MYWQVGLKIGSERGHVNVHPQTLEDSKYDNAIEHALEMTQALYPNHRVEFEYVKEYDI